jgi:UDP-glucuronate decarboxylase
MKKVALITGGAGFLGSHLCDFLLEKNFKVIALDNLYTGNLRNIKHLKNNKDFKFIKKDVRQKIKISGKIDWIFNLACPASPIWYQKDPLGTLETSIIGATNMLNLAKEKKARILQASTSEIYGDPLEHPQKETYKGNVNTLGPRACYDEGKRVAETIFSDHHRIYKTDIKIIRIFNTYGPRMSKEDGRVVSNFIIQALNSEPITMFGDGSQTRSFQYVSDLIEGIYQMMLKDNFVGPVNLGNPGEFTVMELAKKVIEKTNSKSKIVLKDLPKDDPTKRKPDIELAKKTLNWEPKINLDSGLEKTIEYFKNMK